LISVQRRAMSPLVLNSYGVREAGFGCSCDKHSAPTGAKTVGGDSSRRSVVHINTRISALGLVEQWEAHPTM
jgi:hypothetical protein